MEERCGQQPYPASCIHNHQSTQLSLDDTTALLPVSMSTLSTA